MDTPYDRGIKAGKWTTELLISTGYTDEARKRLGRLAKPKETLAEAAKLCLADCEKNYASEMESCKDFKPDHAANHRAYMNGVIASERETLNAIINEGGN